MYRYAVFQGGGVKGIALVGALEVAEHQGLSFAGVGGTSAGAIVAGLYAAGYTSSEMRTIMETDFSSLLDRSSIGPWALYRRLGLYKGRGFHRWLHKLFSRKKVYKFKDCRIPLRIVASDLTARRLLVLDAQSQPDLDVSEAVRMSMSIPLMFEPRRLGEHLIVDGGLLSNFPTTLFNRDETLGFRLRTKSDRLDFAPQGVHGLLLGMIGTMLDGRDNYDLETKDLAGVIEIDPGPVSTTQFSLDELQKDDLYNRGVSAASVFFADELNRLRSNQLIVSGQYGQLKVDVPKELPGGLNSDVEIRFSISGLICIESSNKLLLVKGHRIDQFQPIGGVYKILRGAELELKKLGMRPDTKFPIDEDSEGDLRVLVPSRSCSQFLDWYLDGRGRETYPWREFYEEVLQPDILPKQHFITAAFERVATKVRGIKFSEHFQCWEVLIAEIFRLIPTAQQETELSRLVRQGNTPKAIWASPELIRSRGYNLGAQRQDAVISETAGWLLDFEDRENRG